MAAAATTSTQTGQQTTAATAAAMATTATTAAAAITATASATMAAVASHSRIFAAHEGETNDREENRDTQHQCTIHPKFLQLNEQVP
jgi:hypothetical protein